MVAAAMKAVFVIQAPDQVSSHWQRVTEMLRKQFLPGVNYVGGAPAYLIVAMHRTATTRRALAFDWHPELSDAIGSPAQGRGRAHGGRH